MGYVVRPDGSILVENADEAIILAKRMAANGHANGVVKAPKPQADAETKNGSGGWDEMVKLMKQNQKDVLTLIRHHGSATLKDISEKLGGGNSAAAGVLTAIKRNAKKAGVKESTLFRRESKGYGKQRVVTYYAGSLLKSLEDSAM